MLIQHAYHSENYEGIVWYLKQNNPGLKYFYNNNSKPKNIKQLLTENKHKADFVICVDENMTTTY